MPNENQHIWCETATFNGDDVEDLFICIYVIDDVLKMLEFAHFTKYKDRQNIQIIGNKNILSLTHTQMLWENEQKKHEEK